MAEYYEDLNAMPLEERKRRHCYTQTQLDNQNKNKHNPFGRNDCTPEELRERSAKGGRNKAKARRMRKAFKEMLNELLDEPAKDKDGNDMDVTWAELITERALVRASGFNESANNAFNNLLAVIEEKPTNGLDINISNMPEVILKGFENGDNN